jgi:two-component system, OmpR family, sensor histidine kinase ArlS
MKKLLDKTLRVYIIFSLVVIMVSAPLFYFFTEKLFIDDADETLLLLKSEFKTYTQPSFTIDDIRPWNKISRDVKITDSISPLKHDTVFHKFYFDTLANENEPYRVLLSPLVIEGKPYTFFSRISLIESEDLVKNLAVLFCATLAFLLTGLFLITRRMSLRLWRPFYSTLQQVEQFELDKNSNPSLAATDVEEFRRLNQSINKLIEKNITVYKDQQEFIENAAHELQTPVAVFQAKLDVLAQHIPITAEVGETLSQLNEAVFRLNRINKNLLLLSKIDNDQFTASELVSLNDILEKQIPFLKEQALEKKIIIEADDINSATINANKTLLEIAITNLLLNALQHNVEGGKISITLDQNQLAISNTGDRSALSAETLFKRFSPNRSEGGNGLGLAIVKKICKQHGWTINYSFIEELHFFTIAF